MESRNSLKQRLTRLFRPSTLLRSSCNSSSSSSSALFTSSSATSTATAADEPVFIPHDTLFLRRLDRSLSLSSSRVLSTLDCTRCGPDKSSGADVVVSAAAKGSAKKERRVRETGELYETGKREGRTCPPASPASPAKIKKKKKKKKKILSTNAYGFSSSSDDVSDFFSGADETETFLSSRSFSSDSSDFYKRPKRKKKKSGSSRIPPRMCRRITTRNEEETEAKSGGVPVMKRSTDPYVDFRDSMAEMIVERQIFGAIGLEKLLLSYLSLNSPLLHPVILRAFSDISRVLFGH